MRPSDSCSNPSITAARCASIACDQHGHLPVEAQQRRVHQLRHACSATAATRSTRALKSGEFHLERAPIDARLAQEELGPPGRAVSGVARPSSDHAAAEVAHHLRERANRGDGLVPRRRRETRRGPVRTTRAARRGRAAGPRRRSCARTPGSAAARPPARRRPPSLRTSATSTGGRGGCGLSGFGPKSDPPAPSPRKSSICTQ